MRIHGYTYFYLCQIRDVLTLNLAKGRNSPFAD